MARSQRRRRSTLVSGPPAKIFNPVVTAMAQVSARTKGQVHTRKHPDATTRAARKQMAHQEGSIL